MIESIFSTLFPVFGLMLLGGLLRHIGFLDRAMEDAMNRYTYWIALPIFIALGMARAPAMAPPALRGTLALCLCTLALVVAGYLLAALLRLPKRSRGTFVQAGFRGNLAYIGLPVIAFALRDDSEATQKLGNSLAILTMTPTVLLYNLLGVMVLEWDRRHLQASHPLLTWFRSTARNPLIIACLLGGLWNLLKLPVPDLALRSLSPLAATAFPLALLAIGARIRSLPWHQTGRGLFGACLVKNLLGLLFAHLLCRALGVDELTRLIVLVLASTPTAVASFVLVDQLDGDRDLGASTIAGTTLASLLGLATALWLA